MTGSSRLSSALSPAWRTPVVVGIVLTAVLTLLAIPLLWRPFGVATNPGLHDRDYGLRLGIALAIVWVVVGATGLAQLTRAKLALGRDQSSS
jgi:hypothetical protein